MVRGVYQGTKSFKANLHHQCINGPSLMHGQVHYQPAAAAVFLQNRFGESLVHVWING